MYQNKSVSVLTQDLISCASQHLHVIKSERLPISNDLPFIQVLPYLLHWLQVRISVATCRWKRLAPGSVRDHPTSRESEALHWVLASMASVTDTPLMHERTRRFKGFAFVHRVSLTGTLANMFLDSSCRGTQLSSFPGTSVFLETTWQGGELWSKVLVLFWNVHNTQGRTFQKLHLKISF